MVTQHATGAKTLLPLAAVTEQNAVPHETVVHPDDQCHRMEHRLHHHLTNHPEYEFSDLVIHRIPNGVCLEGRLHVRPGAPDLDAEISHVLGRCQVVNRIVVFREGPHEIQRKLFDNECGCPD